VSSEGGAEMKHMAERVQRHGCARIKKPKPSRRLGSGLSARHTDPWGRPCDSGISGSDSPLPGGSVEGKKTFSRPLVRGVRFGGDHACCVAGEGASEPSVLSLSLPFRATLFTLGGFLGPPSLFFSGSLSHVKRRLCLD